MTSLANTRRAVFLDRDGTIIRDVHFLAREEQVELLPGVGAAIRRLNKAGVPVIVATNQSGLARGYIRAEDYESVRARLDALLAAEHAHIDATYMCPHHPDVSGPCDCRKPETGMYRQAATEHGLDLGRSVYIGDRWRDVAPGLALGGYSIMVPSTVTPREELSRAQREAHVVTSLGHAVELALTGQIEAHVNGDR